MSEIGEETREMMIKIEEEEVNLMFTIRRLKVYEWVIEIHLLPYVWFFSVRNFE